ncbi:MAG TPA: NAD(P)/FAD-dependent oxidoreductase [Vineibacter sp.]|nr:NAD(P)/FAD-dependent oxidoreductase [Vineibacter sp.]
MNEIMRSDAHRRTVMNGLTSIGAPFIGAPRVLTRPAAAIVIVGGGFAGATCARELRRQSERLAITLVEPNARFTACPSSNEVIAGLRGMDAQQFGYDALKRDGIAVVQQDAVAVDPRTRLVRLRDGSALHYTRLVLAPGIDLRFSAITGYGAAAVDLMPHAWKAGPQTVLLRRQLDAMDDGGLVVISVPANPFRCPPAPYERASLIAHFLKTRKPRAKLIILDAKDSFAHQHLFQAAWQDLYPGILEWVPLSSGGAVSDVDPAAKIIRTDRGRHRADVANIIPPQKAGVIARLAGVADRTGWCPVDPVSFESRLQPDIHVVGDAAIAGALPKSAFAASSQAKICAAAIASLVRGLPPADHRIFNTSYSLVAPDYGISVAGVYRPRNGQLTEVESVGTNCPLGSARSHRAEQARHAKDWFRTITSVTFG